MRIEELEKYAQENNIPIIEQESITWIKESIQEYNVKSILEIGSAIGYSAIRMVEGNKDIHVTTIERDEKRYQEAIKNIEEFGLTSQIEVKNIDALDIDLYQKYDMIFIDAAKSQYINFFNKFKENLNPNGIIISDNLKFHGLVDTEERVESRNVRGIIRKIRNYIDFLESNEEFITTFVEIGDGLSLSKKVEK